MSPFLRMRTKKIAKTWQMTTDHRNIWICTSAAFRRLGAAICAWFFFRHVGYGIRCSVTGIWFGSCQVSGHLAVLILPINCYLSLAICLSMLDSVVLRIEKTYQKLIAVILHTVKSAPKITEAFELRECPERCLVRLYLCPVDWPPNAFMRLL